MCSSANPTEEDNLNSTAAMTSTLGNDFNQSFAQNQATLGNLTSALQQSIAKPQGFTSGQMAGLRTGAMDTNTQQFDAAKANAGAAAARYGGDVASGVTGQIEGGLAGEEAANESGEQNEITQANAQQQQANYWKGIQGLSNVAALQNPTGYANAATGSSNATTGAANAVTSEQQQGWQDTMGVISGIAGLGSAGAKAFTGFGGGSGSGGSSIQAPGYDPDAEG
jgi:hypothetical protein